MMMNDPVEIVGASAASARGIEINERLVALHRRLKRIAKARAHLDLKEAEALREAQTLQLWKQFGHVSLVDYMVQELGYSSWRTAEDRLRLANALPALPKLTEAIQCGQLNMSQARELARVATPETEEKWIEKAQDLNVRQVEQAVAGHTKGDLPEDPIDPRLVRKTLYLSVRPETEVLFRDARKALEKERAERLDDDAVLEALCLRALRIAQRADQTESTPAPAPNALDAKAEDADANRPHESTHVGDEATSPVQASTANPSNARSKEAAACRSATGAPGGRDVVFANASGAPYRIAVTICDACKRGWQHGSGAVVEMSPPALERAQCDAQWIGDVGADIVERVRQSISPATRRNVLHRDKGRCRVPGCQCHSNLDVHHIVHRRDGGTHEMSNLVTLCEAHHLAHHDGTLTIVRESGEITFRFEGRNKFTRTAREVATREALRKRGIDRERIKTIIARTVNEIGNAALSDEQWLTIALRYADESRN